MSCANRATCPAGESQTCCQCEEKNICPESCKLGVPNTCEVDCPSLCVRRPGNCNKGSINVRNQTKDILVVRIDQRESQDSFVTASYFLYPRAEQCFGPFLDMDIMPEIRFQRGSKLNDPPFALNAGTASQCNVNAKPLNCCVTFRDPKFRVTSTSQCGNYSSFGTSYGPCFSFLVRDADDVVYPDVPALLVERQNIGYVFGTYMHALLLSNPQKLTQLLHDTVFTLSTPTQTGYRVEQNWFVANPSAPEPFTFRLTEALPLSGDPPDASFRLMIVPRQGPPEVPVRLGFVATGNWIVERFRFVELEPLLTQVTEQQALQFRVSIIPTDADFRGAGSIFRDRDFVQLPTRSEQYNTAIGSATLTVLSLPPAFVAELTHEIPWLGARCCMSSDDKSWFQRQVCQQTNLHVGRGGPTKNCDVFMACEWCRVPNVPAPALCPPTPSSARAPRLVNAPKSASAATGAEWEASCALSFPNDGARGIFRKTP